MFVVVASTTTTNIYVLYQLNDVELTMTNKNQIWKDFVLLLIDVQNDFWTEEMAEHFPNFSENVSSLLTLCRNEGIDIVHLRASFKADQSD